MNVFNKYLRPNITQTWDWKCPNMLFLLDFMYHIQNCVPVSIRVYWRIRIVQFSTFTGYILRQWECVYKNKQIYSLLLYLFGNAGSFHGASSITDSLPMVCSLFPIFSHRIALDLSLEITTHFHDNCFWGVVINAALHFPLPCGDSVAVKDSGTSQLPSSGLEPETAKRAPASFTIYSVWNSTFIRFEPLSLKAIFNQNKTSHSKVKRSLILTVSRNQSVVVMFDR